MKKLLFQFDTDAHASTFDTVVAYDGGADHVIGHANVSPDNVGGLVDGCIFTRAPKDKKNTAIFIGGSNMAAGEALFEAVTNHFFQGFSVSVMLDSNGCNTTAAAAIARVIENFPSDSTNLLDRKPLSNQKAVVLAGTGPVGQRAAAMLALKGADVSITSRNLTNAEKACAAINQRFNVEVSPLEASDDKSRATSIKDANIILATGASGVQLLKPEHWQDNQNLRVIVDANATPPVGIGGTNIMDKGKSYNGKIVWGAIGFGALKLELHRECIKKLFVKHDTKMDAEYILSAAIDLVNEKTINQLMRTEGNFAYN